VELRLAGRHVLLGVSGGVAAYKSAELARALLKEGATVQAVLTEAATAFVGTATFEGLTGRPAYTGIFQDVHRVLHLRLAREADVAVFAPATQNVVAKLAAGLADDLLSSLYSCLRCPTLVAPAMHTEMWEHPGTQRNIATLGGWGTRVVGPDDGALAGGDIGPGRMADPGAILEAVVAAVTPADGPLAGKRVVVTAGGTREPIDPVRFIGNRSSGKMGYAVAAEAHRRGAVVDLVSGPVALPAPPGVTVTPVGTAIEMREAVLGVAEKADVIVKAAAVADFRPVAYSDQKLKKEELLAERDPTTSVTLVATPDILAELGAAKNGRLLVGFAAETDLEEQRGREKLHRKGLDLIVVNRVDFADAGFNVDTNRGVLLRADGSRRELALTTKADLARIVLDEVEELLTARRGPGPEHPT